MSEDLKLLNQLRQKLIWERAKSLVYLAAVKGATGDTAADFPDLLIHSVTGLAKLQLEDEIGEKLS